MYSMQHKMPKVSHFFFEKKNVGKWDILGTLTQKVLFLDYNKTKKEKSGTLLGHIYYIPFSDNSVNIDFE